MAGILPLVDTAQLTATLDGVPLTNLLAYHYNSDRVFYVTGDLSLQSVFDSCITGSRQPAVSASYFFIIKELGTSTDLIELGARGTRHHHAVLLLQRWLGRSASNCRCSRSESDEARALHQPNHALSAYEHVMRAQLGVHARAPVRPPTARVCFADKNANATILDGVARRRSSRHG